MISIPKTEKGIRSKITRIKSSLRKEKKYYGFIRDGGGKRYLLGPLYLMLGDINGAIESFEWFDKEFSDDSGDPFQYLCWSLAYYQAGQLEKAEDKLIQTMMQNLYLIPHLLKIEQPEYQIWHSSNWEEKAHVDYLPVEYEELWDDEALEWMAETYNAKRCSSYRERHIEIHSQLLDEPRGPKRSRLVKESSELAKLRFK